MASRQVMTVIPLAAVLAWSTVMTVLGELTAVAALLPSLGLPIQQIVSALSGTNTRTSAAAAGSPTVRAAGSEEQSR
ncbi:hypothetical protein ACIP8U_41970 [Streptomyces pseudovenezuelae]|uniref:hypothetical protein n=1 Tax=Streptomyces pseudovenezuelae TaxID=67350 RepID=UPI0036E374CF